jgi:predicted GNAT family N-acyltransferase
LDPFGETMITPETQALRKRLAKIYQLKLFQVEVSLDSTKGLVILVDGKDLSETQHELFIEEIQRGILEAKARIAQEDQRLN